MHKNSLRHINSRIEICFGFTSAFMVSPMVRWRRKERGRNGRWWWKKGEQNNSAEEEHRRMEQNLMNNLCPRQAPEPTLLHFTWQLPSRWSHTIIYAANVCVTQVVLYYTVRCGKHYTCRCDCSVVRLPFQPSAWSGHCSSYIRIQCIKHLIINIYLHWFSNIFPFIVWHSWPTVIK